MSLADLLQRRYWSDEDEEDDRVLTVRIPCRVCYRLTVADGYDLNYCRDRPICAQCAKEKHG